MFQQQRTGVPASKPGTRTDEQGMRMALGPLGGTPAPRPKPFEQKACLIAQKLEQLGKELEMPETTNERSNQIKARIADLGRRAEWLLGGEFEQGTAALRDALQKRIFASSNGVKAELYTFAARALRGSKGLPAPAASQPSISHVMAGGVTPAHLQRMFPSPVPPSQALVAEYLAYLSSLHSPSALVAGIQTIPGHRGGDFEVLDDAITRNEAGLLLGGLRILLLEKVPSHPDARALLPQVSNMEADHALQRCTSGNSFTRASALWLLSSQLRRCKVPQVPSALESPALVAAASDEPRLRASASGVLVYCSSRTALKAHEKLLRDQIPLVKCAALRASFEKGVVVPEGVAIQAIEDLLRSGETLAEIAAAEAGADCLRGCSAHVVGRLVDLAADDSHGSSIRAVALRALERSPHMAAQEALFQHLSSSDDEVAATAAHALAQGAGATLRPRILAQARNSSLSWGARKYAVQALGRKTTAEEQGVLVTFLDSSDPTASLDAAAALAEAETCFVRPRLVKLIESQLTSSNPLSAMSSVIALGRVRTVEERILMLKSLGHSFSVVRQGAAETLLRSGSDALDSSLYLSKVQEVVLAAVKEGISREVELAGALNSLFTEAGIA